MSDQFRATIQQPEKLDNRDVGSNSCFEVHFLLSTPPLTNQQMVDIGARLINQLLSLLLFPIQTLQAFMIGELTAEYAESAEHKNCQQVFWIEGNSAKGAKNR